MPELIFDLKVQLDQASKKTVQNQLNAMQKEVNASASGETKSTQKQTNAEQDLVKAKKEKLKALIREKNIAEANFRIGNLTQAQIEETTADIFKQAQAQDLLSAEVDATGAKYKQLVQAQVRASTGFKGVGHESARANQSLMNLGRIVQDLPFGFLGISNNIDPALTSFRELRKDAGGTGAAFKALLTSLMGSGGLIFALGSLLPSAVLIAQQGWNMYSKSTKDADQALQALNETTRSFINESARLRVDEGGFLSVFEIQGKIESTNRLIAVFSDEVANLERQMGAAERQSAAFGLATGSNVQELNNAESALSRIREEFELTDEDIENINKTLGDFNDQLRRAKAIASLDAFAVYRDQVQQAVDAQVELVDVGLENVNTLVDLRDAYASQAQALREAGLEDEKSMERYVFLVDIYRELSSEIEKYTGEKAIEVDFTMEAAEAVDKETDARKRRLELRKLEQNMPDQEFGPDESRSLAARAFLRSLQSDVQIGAASGMAQRKLEIEKEYQQKRLDVISRFGTETEQVREMFRLLDIQRLRSIEEAKTEIVGEGIEKQKKMEDSLAEYRKQVWQNSFNALSSLSHGFAQDNKAIAIAILAVEKALAISKVIVSGTEKAAQATAQGLAFASNPLTAPLAAKAFAIAASIKAMTAVNAAAIAAQGLGEAMSISNRGGRGQGTSAGGSNVPSNQQGFFTTDDRIPKRPQPSQPIYVSLEGEFDDEVVSVKAQRGDQKRKRSTFFPV